MFVLILQCRIRDNKIREIEFFKIFLILNRHSVSPEGTPSEIAEKNPVGIPESILIRIYGGTQLESLKKIVMESMVVLFVEILVKTLMLSKVK